MLGKFLRPLYGRKQLYRFWWKLYRLSLHGMNIGLGAGVESSGEMNVLSYVKAHSPEGSKLVIFDVGANKGQYTQSVLASLSNTNAEIHCFEPGHETFRILSEAVGNRKNVVLNNFGLSDKKSEGIL